MIERYGTGIPRIKRDCDAAGVKFGYRQTVNTTIIRFDRLGEQVTYADEGGNPVPVPADAGAGKQGKGSRAEPSRQLDENEKNAVDAAHEQGRASVKSLAESAGIGRDSGANNPPKTVIQLRRSISDFASGHFLPFGREAHGLKNAPRSLRCRIATGVKILTLGLAICSAELVGQRRPDLQLDLEQRIEHYLPELGVELEKRHIRKNTPIGRRRRRLPPFLPRRGAEG